MDTLQEWFTTRRELSRANAAGAILEDLREGIRSKNLEVGVKLPSEIALAGQYGVSRPVVREALRSAQALGLTHTKTGSGTYVVSEIPQPPTRFGAYSTRDLLESRPVIEAPAARLAAIRRSDEQAAELLRICTNLEHEVKPRLWVVLDSLFHVTVAEASGNAVFAAIVADTREALSQQSEIINLVAHRREASNVEHREIAQAINEQDPDRAIRAMQLHLSYVEVIVRPMIEEG